MKILSTNVYVGPNMYARFPVIRHILDLGILEGWPTGRLGKAFRDGLVDRLPGLAQHGCSYQEPGGFIRRLSEDEGTWPGHVMEHVAIELQNMAGSDVTFRKRDDKRFASDQQENCQLLSVFPHDFTRSQTPCQCAKTIKMKNLSFRSLPGTEFSRGIELPAKKFP